MSDLVEIGDLESYIKHSELVLIYCSRGYFQSKNCMRELVASYHMQKSVISLIDLDETRGGMQVNAVKTQLAESDEIFHKWGFRANDSAPKGTTEWHGRLVWPGGKRLFDYISSQELVEWNRIGHYQDVSAGTRPNI